MTASLAAGRPRHPRWPAWLAAGLRTALLRRPALPADAAPSPLQVLLATAAVLGLDLALQRLAVPGAAQFDPAGWLQAWWVQGPVLLAAWWALVRPRLGRGTGSVAGWWVVAGWGTLPPLAVLAGWQAAAARDAVPAAVAQGAGAWALYALVIAWYGAVLARAAWALGARTVRALLVGVVATACAVAGSWAAPAQPWTPVAPDGPPRPRLRLDQPTIEAQQAAFAQVLNGLAPQRPGVVDVYGITFAPYAPEDVFLRESGLVASVLAERFDAEGRVVQLVNHATTAATLGWATPQNLERTIAAVAARMDRDEDVLLVYLTSHGGADGQLAASHGPLQVEALTAARLRAALDQAGVRHRVLMVSACYSGTWLPVLAGAGTLVVTASDATHTSYGCGTRSELTFFGRALWDEQLRRTRAFDTAFAAAVPVIRQREAEAGKSDGFSNPQFAMGPAVRPVLDALARQLDAGAPSVPFAPSAPPAPSAVAAPQPAPAR